MSNPSVISNGSSKESVLWLWVTVPELNEAQRIATALLQRNSLPAIHPGNAQAYRWKGQLRGFEIAMVIKTASMAWPM